MSRARDPARLAQVVFGRSEVYKARPRQQGLSGLGKGVEAVIVRRGCFAYQGLRFGV